MEKNIARRSVLTVAALTTAGALALTPVTVAPLDAHSPTRISDQTVALADAWSQLFTDTASSVTGLVTMTIGANNNYPLPSPTFPLAPVVTQLVLNEFAYAGLLLTGQGGQVPGWIGAHLTEVGKIAQLAVSAVPGVAFEQLKAPFFAAAQTLEFIANSANPLTALFQAPGRLLEHRPQQPVRPAGIHRSDRTVTDLSQPSGERRLHTIAVGRPAVQDSE